MKESFILLDTCQELTGYSSARCETEKIKLNL